MSGGRGVQSTKRTWTPPWKTSRSLQCRAGARQRYCCPSHPVPESGFMGCNLCVTTVTALQSERVLFHYNGHGVPRPTTNGEVWVFNKSYTQYIPMSIYDLQTWVGTPAIYLFDCSAAGLIVNSFKSFAEQRQQVRKPDAS